MPNISTLTVAQMQASTQAQIVSNVGAALVNG